MSGAAPQAALAGRQAISPTPGQGPPALVYWSAQAKGLRIAALPVLDRLVVALHRGGVGSITIVAPADAPVPPSELKRAAALRIPWRVVPAPPVLRAPTLVASPWLLVQADDVRLLLALGGRLCTRDGIPLAIGVMPSDKQLKEVAGHSNRGDRGNEDLPNSNPVRGQPRDACGHPEPWLASLDALPNRRARGVACLVTDAASARIAGNQLWASITSSTDGFVDRWFNRPCGRPLSRLLVRTPITPNAVSLASVALGLAAAVGFGSGGHAATILAAVLFQGSAVVDCVDGDLARVAFKETPLGKWLDIVGDQVVHGAVFAGIAVGLVRGGQVAEGLGLALGLSAILGALLSFAVVLRGMLQPVEHRSEKAQRLLDAATTRDFSVLVLALACFQRLDWFLWMAAIGSHIFWILALALQRSSRRQGAQPR